MTGDNKERFLGAIAGGKPLAGFKNAALGHFNAAIAADPGYIAAPGGRAQVFLLAR